MKLTIEFNNGGSAVFENEDAVAVESAIDRAVKLGDSATNNVKLSDGRFNRIFVNSIAGTIIEY